MDFDEILCGVGDGPSRRWLHFGGDLGSVVDSSLFLDFYPDSLPLGDGS